MDIKAILDDFSRLCVYNNNNYGIKMLGAIQLSVGSINECPIILDKASWSTQGRQSLNWQGPVDCGTA